MGKYKRYAQTSIVLALIITLALAIGPTIRTLAAETIFKIQNAELTSISDGAEGTIASFDESNIISNVVFHHLNDSATYKITLKNSDSKDHIIETITDDNENSYISYNYNKHENELINAGNNLVFDLTATYSTANTDPSLRVQSTNVKFYIHFTDVEEPVEIDLDVPNTGANTIAKTTSEKNQGTLKTTLGIIIAASAGLIVIAIIAVKKHKKFAKITAAFVIAGSAFAIAANVKAVVTEINSFTITTEYGLYDKLIIHNGDEDVIIDYGKKLEDVNEIVEPTKPGYTFEGWEDENGTDIDPNNPIVNDVTIKPKFTAITYTIKYNGNGAPADQQMSDQVLTYDQAQNLTTNTFTWEGHNFSGWDTTITGNGTYYADGQEVKNLTTTNNDVITLYAQWSVNPYHIEYDANGGTGEMAVTNCEYEHDCVLRQNTFTKYGYDFKGWTFDGNNYDDEATVRNLATSGTITMVAKWEAHEYQITYTGLTDAEAAALHAAGNPDFYTIETQSFQLHNPADRKDNDGDTTQMFLGWREITTITPVIILPMQDYLGDKTFEAVWQDKAFPRYDITYNLDGGEVATANPATHDKTETFTLNNPTKAGYVFVGWTGTTIEGDTPVHDYTLPAPHVRSAIEFTAHYNRNTYTVNFNGNENTSGSTASMTMAYDEAQSLTANGFAKTGYIFNGWKYNNTDYSDGEEVINLTTEPNGVVEMVAQWQPTQYTIIFHANNENVENPDAMAEQVVTYDEEVALNANAYTWWQHKIVEWTTNANGTGTKYADKATIKNLNANGGEVHLYAKWRVIDAALDGRGNLSNKNITNKLKAITIANPDAKNFLHYPNGEPSDEIKASATDLSGTIDPIYAWAEGENIYWWSEDVKPRISTNNSVEYHYYGVGKSTAEGKVNNLEYMDLTGFDTTGIVGARSPFEYTNIRRVDISDWDLSNATDMGYFAYNAQLTEIIFPEVFDVQKVTNVAMAFNGAKIVNLDLSSWKTRDLKNASSFINMSSVEEVKFSRDFSTANVTTMASMFAGSSKLSSLDLSMFNTANVQNMSGMFNGVSNMTTLDISNFNTGAVTSMGSMFANMTKLETLTVGSNFTAASVTGMSSIFANDTSLTSLDLSSWGATNSLTNLNRAFSAMTNLATLDLTGWDLSNVNNLDHAFHQTRNIETIYASSDTDPSKFTEDNLTWTFKYATPKIVGGAGSTGSHGMNGVHSRIDDPDNGKPGYFTYKNARYIRYNGNGADNATPYGTMTSEYLKAGDSLKKNTFTRRGFRFTGWKDADDNEYTDEQVMADLAESKTPLELYAQWSEITATLNTGANVNNALKRIAGDATSFEMYTAGTPDFSTIDGEQIISANNSPAKVYVWQDAEAGKIYWWSEAYQPKFNANSASMFAGLTKLTNIDLTDLNASTATNLSNLYKGDTALVSTNITAQDTSNVTNMNSMFMNTGFTELSLEGLETNNVTDMANMFNGAKRITTLDTTPLNTEKVTTMSAMFANTTALDSINLTDFDTSSVTNMSSMFSASGISSVNLASFDTTNVTNISSMFKSTANLATVDLSPLEVQSVTTMASLFESSGITSIDVAPLATESVTDMSAMFKNTLGLTELNVAPLNTTNVTTMKDMFYGSYHLASLDVSMLDTANVQNMSGTFGILGRQTILKMYDTPETTKFTTSAVTDMSSMFRGDRELNQGLVNIDLSHIDTSKVTNMSNMFVASRASSLDFSQFDTRKVTNMSQMFFIAPYLSRIDLSAFETPELKNVNQMFYYDGGTGASVIDMRNFDFSKANLANLAPFGPWGGKTYYMGKFDLSSTTANTEINLGSNGTQKIYVNTEYDPSIALERNIRVRVVANGMNGTVANNTTRTYAEYQRIDDPAHDEPGFFWIENPLVVNFDAQGGTASRTKYSYIPGTDYGTLPTATNGPEGTVFAGWYTAAEDGEKVEDNDAFISNDTHTLYAHWGIVEAHFKPRYNSFSNLGTTTAGITNFAKAPTTPTEEFLNTSAVVISDETSPTPIYGWIDGANFYWWSEDATPALNENSNYFFNLFRDLKTIDFTGLDFSQVKKMTGMFKQTQIESIDLSWLDTSNVTLMDSLFEDCGKLTTANLGGSFANLNNVTDMSYMFSGAGLEVIDIESWGWHTNSLKYMNSMFGQSLTPSTIKRVILGENFDSSHVTDMNNLFEDASKLEYVDFEHLDTSSVTQMQKMFFGVSLSELHLENFDTRNVETFGGMFSYAPNLTKIYVGENFVVGSDVHDTHIFKNSTKLVGGAGTTYDATPYSGNGDDIKYLRIDDPAHDNPGYLTFAN